MKQNQYYTATQAQKVLGLSKAMFFRKVNQGLIPKFTPTGNKQGMYPKRDIDALALATQSVFEQFERIVFSRSTPGDQVEEMDIGIRCFGSEFITPLAQRIAFQQKSEFTFWSLKVSGKVVGYVSMFRFPPQFLDDLLTGRKIERDITVKEVLPFVRLESFSVYIDVIAVDPLLSPGLRSFYAGMIIQRVTNAILNLLANGYQMETLYTVSSTKEGDNLVRKLGFQVMKGKSIAPGRIAYQFPLQQEGRERLKHFTRREG